MQALRFEEWDHRLESTIEACLHSLTELTQRVEAGVDDDVIRQLASRINVCERRLNGKSVSHESDESNLHPESDPELEPEPELDSDFLSKMGSMLAAVNGLSNRAASAAPPRTTTASLRPSGCVFGCARFSHRRPLPLPRPSCLRRSAAALAAAA